MKEITFCTNS